jgi:hypothetical protein
VDFPEEINIGPVLFKEDEDDKKHDHKNYIRISKEVEIWKKKWIGLKDLARSILSSAS